MSRWILCAAIFLICSPLAVIWLGARRFLKPQELRSIACDTFGVDAERLELSRSPDCRTVYVHLPERPSADLALLFSQRIRGRLPPGMRVALVPLSREGRPGAG